jgi:lipopolysaccharide O-acetyltransferase
MLREDGSYVVSCKLRAWLFGVVRSTLLGRRLGVKTIRIGARPFLSGLAFVQMGEGFWAEEGLWMEAVQSYNGQTFAPQIIIGKRVHVGRFVHIAATHLVEIGDDVLIGSNVLITDHNHGQYSHSGSSPLTAPALRRLDHDRQVSIGRNVWLGDGVVISPGADIGEGAVIGAHSVVVGTIPPFAVAAGAPASVRKSFNLDSQEWTRP